MSRRRPSGKLGRWVETVTLFEAIEESGPREGPLFIDGKDDVV